MVITLFVRLWQTFLRWRTRRIAIRQLMELDARMLRDIGIDRGQIEAAVDGLARASDTAHKVEAGAVGRDRPVTATPAACEARA